MAVAGALDFPERRELPSRLPETGFRRRAVGLLIDEKGERNLGRVIQEGAEIVFGIILKRATDGDRTTAVEPPFRGEGRDLASHRVAWHIGTHWFAVKLGDLALQRFQIREGVFDDPAVSAIGGRGDEPSLFEERHRYRAVGCEAGAERSTFRSVAMSKQQDLSVRLFR